jgi:hypothetical protein
VSYWDTPDVSESFAGGCRVTNTGLNLAVFMVRLKPEYMDTA